MPSDRAAAEQRLEAVVTADRLAQVETTSGAKGLDGLTAPKTSPVTPSAPVNEARAVQDLDEVLGDALDVLAAPCSPGRPRALEVTVEMT